MIYGFGFAAFLIAWLLPGHYQPWTSFQQETAAAVGGVLIVLAAVAVPMGRTMGVPRVAAVCLAASFIPMVQWTAGLVPFLDDALLPALYLAGTALVIVAVRAIVMQGDRSFVTAFFLTMLTGALVSAGIGLGQWLQFTPGEWTESMRPGERVYGNLTQPNHLASLLALGSVALVWCYETRRIRGTVAFLGWGLLGFSLSLTGSRAGWLIVLTTSVWLWLMRERAGLRTQQRHIFLAGLLFAGFVALRQPLSEALLLDSGQALLDRLQPGTRWQHWQTLWDALGRSPWVGYGWYQVSAAQQVAAVDYPAVGEWIVHSHNLVLDLLIWNGVPLGLLLVAGLSTWVWARAIGCRHPDTWALMAGCGALLVHALLEYPLNYLYFLIPIAVMIGSLEAEHKLPARPGILAWQASRWTVGCLLVTVAGMTAWVAVEYLEVEEASRRVRLLEAGYVTPGLDPHAPDVELLEGPREILRLQLTSARAAMRDDEIEWMRKVSRRYAQPGALSRYALAAALNGREQEASRSLVLLCRIWGRKFCDSGREVWASYQTKHPTLGGIPFPADADWGSSDRPKGNAKDR